MLAVRWFSFFAAAEKEIVRVVSEKLYYMCFDSDTELKSIDTNTTASYRMESSSLFTLNGFIASIFGSSQISLAKKPADSTTLLSCVQHDK